MDSPSGRIIRLSAREIHLHESDEVDVEYAVGKESFLPIPMMPRRLFIDGDFEEAWEFRGPWRKPPRTIVINPDTLVFVKTYKKFLRPGRAELEFLRIVRSGSKDEFLVHFIDKPTDPVRSPAAVAALLATSCGSERAVKGE